MMLDSLFTTAISVDLGTSNTLLAVLGKGIVIRQPSVVARKKKTKELIAVGNRAKKMIGKTPTIIEVVKPLKDGVIADFEATRQLLTNFFEEALQSRGILGKIFKPRVAVGIPTGATEVERKAVKDAVLAAGGGKVFLIEEPLAAAAGAGLPIEEVGGSLLIDIGGGKTEITVISLGGIVVGRCIKIAGEEMDEAVANFLRLKYSIVLGEATAEEVKIQLGSVLPEKTERQMVVRGRDLETGLPKSIKVSSGEVREAIIPIIQEILGHLSEVIEETPPELLGDIVARGIVLVGGGSQLRGLDKLIAEETKMPVWVADEPQSCVVRGCGKVLEEGMEIKALF